MWENCACFFLFILRDLKGGGIWESLIKDWIGKLNPGRALSSGGNLGPQVTGHPGEVWAHRVIGHPGGSPGSQVTGQPRGGGGGLESKASDNRPSALILASRKVAEIHYKKNISIEAISSYIAIFAHMLPSNLSADGLPCGQLIYCLADMQLIFKLISAISKYIFTLVIKWYLVYRSSSVGLSCKPSADIWSCKPSAYIKSRDRQLCTAMPHQPKSGLAVKDGVK